MKFLGIRKRSWKKIFKVGLSALLIIGAVMGAVSLFNRDTTKISPTAFSRGAIDVDGRFIESSTSIVTKDAFLCQGLHISPDFDANGKFEVYYYDVNDKLLNADKNLDSTYVGNYPAAVYARVVYTPEKPADVKTSDWKIGLLEVTKYAKQLTITVNKEQVEYKSSVNLYKAESTTGSFDASDVSAVTPNVNMQASQFVEIDGSYDLYMIYVMVDGDVSADVNVAFKCGANNKAVYLDENGKNKDGYAYTFTAGDMISESWYSVVVEVPHDATALRIQGPVNAEYQIYGVEVK